MDYPSDWNIDPFSVSGSPLHSEMMVYTTNYNAGLYEGLVRVGIYENPSQLFFQEKASNLEDWLVKITKDPEIMASYSIGTLGGLKAYMVYWPGVTTSDQLLIENNGKVYYLEIEDDSDTYTVNIFNKIVSSFKFTN